MQLVLILISVICIPLSAISAVSCVDLLNQTEKRYPSGSGAFYDPSLGQINPFKPPFILSPSWRITDEATKQFFDRLEKYPAQRDSIAHLWRSSGKFTKDFLVNLVLNDRINIFPENNLYERNGKLSITNFSSALWLEYFRINNKYSLPDSGLSANDIEALLYLNEMNSMFNQNNSIPISKFSVGGSRIDAFYFKLNDQNYLYIPDPNINGEYLRIADVEQGLEIAEESHRQRVERNNSWSQAPPETFSPVVQVAGLGLSKVVFPDRPYTFSAEKLLVIEKHLKHLSPDSFHSVTGFIGPHDSLTDLLLRDNKTVEELGTSHQEIANWMRDLFLQKRSAKSRQYEFTGINGRRFKVSSIGHAGIQSSPFRDGSSWGEVYNITDLETSTQMSLSGGHPFMIGFYGFYEGNVPYRVAPEDIIYLMRGYR